MTQVGKTAHAPIVSQRCGRNQPAVKLSRVQPSRTIQMRSGTLDASAEPGASHPNSVARALPELELLQKLCGWTAQYSSHTARPTTTTPTTNRRSRFPPCMSSFSHIVGLRCQAGEVDEGQLLMNQADRDWLVALKKAKKRLITQKEAALE